jgi:hypothetical protein
MLSRPIVLGWMWGGIEARGGPRRDEHRARRRLMVRVRGDPPLNNFLGTLR